VRDSIVQRVENVEVQGDLTSRESGNRAIQFLTKRYPAKINVVREEAIWEEGKSCHPDRLPVKQRRAFFAGTRIAAETMR